MADRVVRGALAYRTLLIWPYAVASAVAGVLWLFLFAPSIGIITFALRSLGINWDWLLQGDQAMLLVVIAATWKQISYNFLFFLAGLQSIPRSLIEAAAIDGAGPARRFWTIVFPLLSPTAFFLLVVNIVYAFFDTFGVIDATTQGGPAGATQILVYKVYYDGVKAADLGGSSAQSVILMAIVIALTVVQFRYHRAEGAVLMVENRPGLTVFAHAVLIAGILVVAFPLYVTFVASTRTLDDILQRAHAAGPRRPAVGELLAGAGRGHHQGRRPRRWAA